MLTNTELIEEIRKYRLADLSDGMDAIGLVDKGVMNEQMRPLRPGIEFYGFAYPIKLWPKREAVKACTTIEEWREELGKGCHDIYNWIDDVDKENGKDQVIVIDMDGVRGGVWGSEIAMNVALRGMVGAVIDGGCRDSFEVNQQSSPVFSTKRTFTHSYGRVEKGEYVKTINCAGVTVNAGDIICADDDGVLVIPRNRVEEVLKFAKVQLEDDIKTRSSHYDELGFESDETLERLK